MRFSLVGARVPELQSDKDDWINSNQIHLKNIENKAVLIKFWDYSCISCLRNLPYIITWDKKYRQHNLLTIGIHSPEFSFAKNKKFVQEAVSRLGITFPVLLDNQYKNWNSFANNYWPRTILVSPEGRIVHDKIGVGGYEETENAIRKVLIMIKTDNTLPEKTKIEIPEDKYGAECFVQTREIYTSSRQGVFGNDEEFEEDECGIYKDSGKRVDGVLILNGYWVQTDECIFNMQYSNTENYLTFVYSALEVYGVFGSSELQGSILYITQNGRPLSRQEAGDDIKFDQYNHSYIEIDFPRLYKLVKNNYFSTNELKIETRKGTANIYSFTFGTCIKN